MATMTKQNIIEKLENFTTRMDVVEFVQKDYVSAALAKNGLGVSYDSDATEDSKSEIYAFEDAAIWTFEQFGSFVRVYDIAKANEILSASK